MKVPMQSRRSDRLGPAFASRNVRILTNLLTLPPFTASLIIPVPVLGASVAIRPIALGINRGGQRDRHCTKN
jgi:hypothetical protein